MNTVIKRNTTIDLGRFFAAFLVVCLHTAFPIQILSFFIKDIGKIAVPFFLLVSGFYIYSGDSIVLYERFKNGINKVFIVTIQTSTVYLLLRIFKKYYFNLEIQDFNWINFLIFNDTYFTEHLWYMYAYLYVLIIFLGIIKINMLGKLFVLLPYFILILIGFSTLSRTIPNSENNFLYELNWFVTVIPYFLLGMWIKKKHVYFKTFFSRIEKYGVWLIGILFIGLFVEHFLFKIILGKGPGVVTTIMLSTLLFFYATLNVKVFSSDIDFKISNLGRTHSLNIYLYHVLIREIIYITNGFSVKVSILNNSISIFLIALLLSLSIEYVKGFFMLSSFKIKK